MIGVLKQSNDIKDNEIKEILKSNPTKIVDVTYQPYCICYLPNSNIACCDSYNHIRLFDENLNQIKDINNIGIGFFFLTTNNKDRIYISDRSGNEIILTDLDFNKIKTTNKNELNNPWEISYYDCYLYVCNSGNYRINKLNENLDFINSYSLDYYPEQIAINSNVACVRCFRNECIYIYEIDNFTLKFKHDGHNGYINRIGTCFYEYFSENKKWYCYDEFGELNEEIQSSSGYNQMLNHFWDGSITLVNETIICCSYEQQKLILISKKKSLE